MGILGSKYIYGVLREQRLKTGPKKYILRYLVILALVLPFQIVTLMVSYKSALWFVVTVKILLPSMGICISIMTVAESIFRRFNLLENDNVVTNEG